MLGCTEGEDDEGDLQPLEEDPFEGDRKGVAIEAGVSLAGLAGGGGLLVVDAELIVQGLQSRCQEGPLAQPQNAKDQKQVADEEPDKTKGQKREGRGDEGHD